MNKKQHFEVGKHGFSKLFETSTSVGYEIVPLKRKGLAISSKWMDIHYPCKSHIKASIKTNFPMEPTETVKLIYEIFESLEISCPQTFELFNLDKRNGFSMTQHTDANGHSDRIETTRKFKSPQS
jgi:hypothetical protein